MKKPKIEEINIRAKITDPKMIKKFLKIKRHFKEKTTIRTFEKMIEWHITKI